MATLETTKGLIQDLTTRQAELFAERAALLEQAADLHRQAADKLAESQGVDVQLATLKAELFDGFAAAVAAAPRAKTYAEVGAAMDQAEVVEAEAAEVSVVAERG